MDNHNHSTFLSTLSDTISFKSGMSLQLVIEKTITMFEIIDWRSRITIAIAEFIDWCLRIRIAMVKFTTGDLNHRNCTLCLLYAIRF